MKKTIALLLALTMCLAVCGCQEAAQGSTATTAPNSTPAASTPVATACQHTTVTKTVIKEATCTQEGELQVTCDACGENHTETVEKLAHSFADATCTAPKTCTVCGAEEGEALQHSWDEGKVVTEPTEQTEGECLYTCTVCGQAKTEAVPVLNHEHSYEAAITKPTCEKDGYTTYTCRCGDSYTADETAAVGHNYSEATCTESKTCATCGKTKGEPLGHDFQNGSCTRCNEADPDWTNTGSQGLAYEVRDDGVCLITGIGTCTDSDLVIPAEIDGYPVTRIEMGAFYGCTQLTSVVLPDTLERIAMEAFSGCTQLTNLVIPDSVESIQADAFKNCTSLKKVTIGSGLFMLGDCAFVGCTALEEVVISQENAYLCSVDGVVYNKDCTKLMLYPAGRPGDSYTVLEGVTSFLHDAFNGSVNLISVVLPESMTFIEYYAFVNCEKLESVTIPSSVKEIYADAFKNCLNLTVIHFGGTLEQWNAVYKENNWDQNTGAYTVICTDGDIQK